MWGYFLGIRDVRDISKNSWLEMICLYFTRVALGQLPLDRILNVLKGKGRDSDRLLEMHRKNSFGLHRIPHKV